MAETLLYLSRGDVQSLGISPGDTREALLRAFESHSRGLNRSLPKSSLMLGPGHGFQAMPAAWEANGIATVKWIGMAPAAPASQIPGINCLICVSDFATGAVLAVLDGDEITLMRTAGMSAAAASQMAPPAPTTIGFIGCGLQSYAHLDAFLDLFPDLTTALTMSRSRLSAEKLAEEASRRGLAAEVATEADEVLSRSDIVISMVPGGPGLKPFLDARMMKANAFAASIDSGRSWISESLSAFDVLATDSLDQSKAPYDVDGNPVTSAKFGYDLASLAGSGHPTAKSGRSFFGFRGFGLADLALAHLVCSRARENDVGTVLPR